MPSFSQTVDYQARSPSCSVTSRLVRSNNPLYSRWKKTMALTRADRTQVPASKRTDRKLQSGICTGPSTPSQLPEYLQSVSTGDMSIEHHWRCNINAHCCDNKENHEHSYPTVSLHIDLFATSMGNAINGKTKPVHGNLSWSLTLPQECWTSASVPPSHPSFFTSCYFNRLIYIKCNLLSFLLYKL